jgi:soluble lytic murein transglycosylase
MSSGAYSGLSAAEIGALRSAFAESDRGNWIAASRHLSQVTDPAAVKLVTWSRLISDNSTATFSEIVAFTDANPGWPRMETLNLRAERALLSYPMSNEDVVEWFSAYGPQTGEGRIRYGKALIELGRASEGAEWIRRAWVENDFSAARQKEILAAYGQHLNTEAQQNRLARLLWERRTSDARTTAALLGQEARALADARIEFISGSSRAQAALSQVPPALRADPGLLYEQVRYERQRGNDHNALPLLLTAPTEPHKLVKPETWWIERRILARKALADGLYMQAYQIAAGSGLSEGVDFADAEFMAGWIALQFLNKPDMAYGHFRKLEAGVSTPISKARAEYWSARAASAAGKQDDADRYFRQAASYPTTFYGQLAKAALASRGEDVKLVLPAQPARDDTTLKQFSDRELVRAARILKDMERDRELWAVMLHLSNTLESKAELGALSDLALNFGDRKLSLRIAKNALARNIIIADYAYPTDAMPTWTHRGPPVERALVYGLSRQESEFDPNALSPAGARGIMQLMPGTARIVARQVGLPYSAGRLNDPVYNATLGAAHLGDLVENEFGGSYIMSIAAYNAGSSRVRQWVDRFGDPRSTAVDPIDWIETIPFSETRNYVQRVMENLEVYRGRLDGAPQPIRIDQDLRRHTGPAPITEPAPTPRPSNIPLAPPGATPASLPVSGTGAGAPVPVASPASGMAPVIEAEDR